MRTTEDAIRSLKRYVAEVLDTLTTGVEWDVRLAEEQGAFQRPFALVGASGPETWSGSAHLTDRVLPTNANLYPPKGADPETALIEALRLKEVVYQGFRVGVGYGAPMRVPLWDYAGISLNATATNRRVGSSAEGWHNPDPMHGDYLRIRDISVNAVRDPADATLWTVVADVRLGWRSLGRLPSGEALETVTLTPDHSEGS